MTKLLTSLVLASCAALAALLAFHAIGWVQAPASELVSAMIYAAAGLAMIVLIGGWIHDVSTAGNRAEGCALWCTALWFVLAPALEARSVDDVVAQVPVGLVENIVLVIGLYLLLVGRTALRANARPLGVGFVLLALLLVAIDVRLLGGTMFAPAFYLGIGAAAVAFAATLVVRSDLHERIAWVLVVTLVGCYALQLFT